MTSTVSQQGLTEEIEHRTLLLTTGFDHRENALNKLAARIGLSAMRRASPDDGMAQRTFGTVVGGFHAGLSGKEPQRGLPTQQVTTGRRRA